jgi:gamma-glutamylcyclotransferase (GGCT)/AIG2-like uncharacterized protein YtfP
MSNPPPGKTVYFAYGSNMCRNQMARRCQGAESQGLALLSQHRFIINSRGYASVIPHPASRVHGVIWHLTDEQIQTLDHYEDVAHNLYRKKTIRVISDGGTHSFPAMTYVSTHTEQGQPRPPYINSILEAAREFGFPADYLKELESWQPATPS